MFPAALLASRNIQALDDATGKLAVKVGTEINGANFVAKPYVEHYATASLTVTDPATRSDGTALASGDWYSVTILGAGAVVVSIGGRSYAALHSTLRRFFTGSAWVTDPELTDARFVRAFRSIDLNWFTSTNVGTATFGVRAASGGQGQMDVSTGATAASSTCVTGSLGLFDNQGSDSIDFTTRIHVGFAITRASSSANGVFRIHLSNTDAINPLASAGFGIEVRNQRIWLVTYSGGVLTQVDTGADVYASNVNVMRLEATGSGTVHLYRNATLLGSAGGVTTSTGTTGRLSVGVVNGADAALNRWYVAREVRVSTN